MDIHQIMQALGQILYIGIKRLGEWINELSGMLGYLFKDIKIPSSPTVIKLFSNTSVNRIVFFAAVAYIVIINIRAFTLYGKDKKHAKRKQTRISERRLLRVCIWGGAAGGLLGMYMFRHKTLHNKFRIAVPVLFAIQLVLYSFLIGFLGFWTFF